MPMVSAEDIVATLLLEENAAQREHLMRFFKTGKGDYGEGDEFIGLTAPQTRLVVKEAKGLVSLPEIEKLLYSRWHEARLAGFLLVVDEMSAALPKKRDRAETLAAKAARRKELADFYLRHARRANNWDLVDMTCPKILGYYLLYAADKDFSIRGSLIDINQPLPLRSSLLYLQLIINLSAHLFHFLLIQLRGSALCL